MNREVAIKWNNLLKRTKSGDAQAHDELFGELTVTLRPFLELRLRGYSREDKEDVLQETLIIFGQKLGRIKDNPHKYALQILRNKIGHMYRDRTSKVKLSLDSNNPYPHGLKKVIEKCLDNYKSSDELLDEIVKKEQIDQLQKAIGNLPDFCRSLFITILKGYDREELWRKYKSSLPKLNRNAFRKRIFDCRKKLIELLAA